MNSFIVNGDLDDVSFLTYKPKQRPFLNAGFMINRAGFSLKVVSSFTGPVKTLGDVLVDEAKVDPSFYLDDDQLLRWRTEKGAKEKVKFSKVDNIRYVYKEGATSFPDRLDRPSRTIITSEGERSPCRMTHIIQTPDGRYRRLIPVELERLNMFPDDHTIGATNTQRGFFMGNALVVGVVEKIGEELVQRHFNDTESK